MQSDQRNDNPSQVTDPVVLQPPEKSEKQQIRSARAKFAFMGATYFMGVFNDNFFRQTALLMAVSAGKDYLQAIAMLAFTLPFILFGAYAGWVADKFTKRTVVISSKVLELIAMVFAAVGIITLQWPLLIVTLAIMASQSTLFSPAMNGTIPELYPPSYVVRANGIVRMISTTAILTGIAMAGVVQDLEFATPVFTSSAIIAGSILLLVAAVGVALSLGVPKFPAGNPQSKFPISGPWFSTKTLFSLRKDPEIMTAIFAKAYFWGLGSLQILIINPLGVEQMKWSETFTSVLVAMGLIGIAIGGYLSSLFTRDGKFFNTSWQSLAFMALFMTAAGAVNHVPYSRYFMAATMLGIGIAGGIFMIPPASFIQVRAEAGNRGRLIAASNYLDFIGMLLSSPINMLFIWLGLKPSQMLIVMGIVSFLAAGLIFNAIRKFKSTGESDHD